MTRRYKNHSFVRLSPAARSCSEAPGLPPPKLWRPPPRKTRRRELCRPARCRPSRGRRNRPLTSDFRPASLGAKPPVGERNAYRGCWKTVTVPRGWVGVCFEGVAGGERGVSRSCVNVDLCTRGRLLYFSILLSVSPLLELEALRFSPPPSLLLLVVLLLVVVLLLLRLLLPRTFQVHHALSAVLIMASPSLVAFPLVRHHLVAPRVPVFSSRSLTIKTIAKSLHVPGRLRLRPRLLPRGFRRRRLPCRLLVQLSSPLGLLRPVPPARAAAPSPASSSPSRRAPGRRLPAAAAPPSPLPPRAVRSSPGPRRRRRRRCGGRRVIWWRRRSFSLAAVTLLGPFFDVKLYSAVPVNNPAAAAAVAIGGAGWHGRRGGGSVNEPLLEASLVCTLRDGDGGLSFGRRARRGFVGVAGPGRGGGGG